MLKDDLIRSFLLLPIFVAFWLFLHHWVSHWNLLIYCLILPVGVFIIFSLKRVKIVQSSNGNTDADSLKKAPLDKERR